MSLDQNTIDRIGRLIAESAELQPTYKTPEPTPQEQLIADLKKTKVAVGLDPVTKIDLKRLRDQLREEARARAARESVGAEIDPADTIAALQAAQEAVVPEGSCCVFRHKETGQVRYTLDQTHNEDDWEDCWLIPVAPKPEDGK